MNAVEVVKERARMCKAIFTDKGCVNCNLDTSNNGKNLGCREYQIQHPEKVVAIVEEWSKANPERTYSSDFIEKFPNCLLTDSGRPKGACKKKVYGLHLKSCAGIDCLDCWNEPMEVVK